MEIPAPKHHSEAFLKIVEAARSRIHEITIDEYRKLLASGQAGQLVDVREEHEWDAAHARGAVHLSKGVIERDIEKEFPDKNTRLVLYCGGGFRSALAADNLNKMGYVNVLSLDGGWRAIIAAELPIESDSALETLRYGPGKQVTLHYIHTSNERLVAVCDFLAGSADFLCWSCPGLSETSHIHLARAGGHPAISRNWGAA